MNQIQTLNPKKIVIISSYPDLFHLNHHMKIIECIENKPKGECDRAWQFDRKSDKIYLK